MRWAFLLPALIFLGLGLGRVVERDTHALPSSIQLNIAQRHMRAFVGYIHDFRRSKGRYPTNDEGLLAIRPLVSAFNKYGWYEGPKDDLRQAYLAHSGIIAPRGDPYIYENRRGLPAASFAGSGANDDPRQEFSAKVDDGVYVWSIGMQQACQDYHAAQIVDAVFICLTLIPGIVLFVFYVREARATSHRRSVSTPFLYALDGLIVGLGYLAWSFVTCFTTCYARSYTRRYVTPEMAHEYHSVMKKYHDRGVISDAAYAKIAKALVDDNAVTSDELK